MEQQIAVTYIIHAPVREEQLHMLLQLLRYAERVTQPSHQFGLCIGEHRGRFGRYGGQVAVLQRIGFPVQDACFLVEVYRVQSEGALHLPLGMTQAHLCFQLELDDGDGLVHACCEHAVLHPQWHLPLGCNGQKSLARVVTIGIHSQCGQRNQVDAVSVLQSSHIGVAQ